MFEVGIKAHFSAAHHLRGYAGSCAACHGHNWEIEVFVRGSELDETGILVDFRVLKDRVKEALAEIDHCDLNQVDAFRTANPTSENIAAYLYRELACRLNTDRHRVARVSVHETPETVSTYWE